ncbi:GNAT family N-acetyltransferase [Proteiniclasticum ruminis]|uniref:Protein N-acetyltransferase, RimJ/RimL family n=1 Tax=Proteiniclasticum ruminis TaxID=398199 RepID=A0A1I5EM38_9CLOT|nr:GNAT family protein [Proteiniclasticum ruminis]SFO12528.1 Protein N-acetyltransferase, RimJ/RimL family [Proteiniclasticum ruminis]
MSAAKNHHDPKELPLKNGELLTIRKPEEQDATSILSYLNQVGGESDNLLFGENEFPLTVEQEISYLKSLESQPGTLMLLGLLDSEIVSVAQISSLPRKRIAHNAEIALSVKKAHWQKGIGRHVMEELLTFARNSGTIRTVSLGVKADNESAIVLYEKLGFKKTGVHKDYFLIRGNYFDELLMDLRIHK